MDARRLVEGLSRGDEAAWREFLATYGRLIYAVAQRFSLRGLDPDDLFQETCIRAHQSIHTLQSPQRLGSWVYTIAYRLGVDALRRERSEARREDEDALAAAELAPHAAPGPDQMLEHLEAVARLSDALGGLEERCRRLLTALYLEDPPPAYVEIGRREEMPVGSIGPTRARCLRKLKTVIRKLSGDPPDPSA